MARVKIESKGPVEHMDVHVSGLPRNTEFDFFVIQLPNAPFGLAWYQGDIETNHEGKGHQKFVGRFKSIANINGIPGRATPRRGGATHGPTASEAIATGRCLGCRCPSLGRAPGGVNRILRASGADGSRHR
jgi:hypothetical protein